MFQALFVDEGHLLVCTQSVTWRRSQIRPYTRMELYHWRMEYYAQGRDVEFLALHIGWERAPNVLVYSMMIERQGFIARRLGLAAFTLRRWLSLDPKLTTLMLE